MPGFFLPGSSLLRAPAGRDNHNASASTPPILASCRREVTVFSLSPPIVERLSRLLRNEPLRRGNGGKPHWAEFCYRTGGETVYVCSRRPNGVTESQYKVILAGNPKTKSWGWRTMRRNPGVYVKGRLIGSSSTPLE